MLFRLLSCQVSHFEHLLRIARLMTSLFSKRDQSMEAKPSSVLRNTNEIRFYDQEADLPPDRPYVFGYHPHGMYSLDSAGFVLLTRSLWRYRHHRHVSRFLKDNHLQRGTDVVDWSLLRGAFANFATDSTKSRYSALIPSGILIELRQVPVSPRFSPGSRPTF